VKDQRRGEEDAERKRERERDPWKAPAWSCVSLRSKSWRFAYTTRLQTARERREGRKRTNEKRTGRRGEWSVKDNRSGEERETDSVCV